jgi:hypothetical protein
LIIVVLVMLMRLTTVYRIVQGNGEALQHVTLCLSLRLFTLGF